MPLTMERDTTKQLRIKCRYEGIEDMDNSPNLSLPILLQSCEAETGNDEQMYTTGSPNLC